jgi:hypothetical protein
VYESFAGTQAQQNAGLAVKAFVLNGAVDSCLEERGYPDWDWSLARGYAAPYDPLRPTEWFAEPGRRVYSDNEVAAREYLAAEAEMNSDESRPEAYDDAIDECLRSAARPSESDAERAAQPSEAANLIEAWRTTMRRAGVELGGNFDAFYRCMDAADIPVLVDAGVGYDEIGPVMASEAGKAGPPPSASQDQATYTDAWKHFLTLEDQVLDADAVCRSEVYAHEIANLYPVIEEFASQHAAEIELAQLAWAKIADRAVGLGYHGQPGPLGK